MEKIQYQQLTPEHFERVIQLGNFVHGDNYLDQQSLLQIYQRSFHQDIKASWVALKGNTLIGFRLTLAATEWQLDEWCSPTSWGVGKDSVCYFKCNTVDQRFRGYGIGSRLLELSIEKAKQQGCRAGLAHIWLASPGNSAYRYFSKCGGKLVKKHPGKWRELSIRDGYCCPICPGICECVAAEMILHFNE